MTPKKIIGIAIIGLLSILWAVLLFYTFEIRDNSRFVNHDEV